MATETSVAKIITFGERKGWIVYKEIKYLAKTCCINAATEVIDFDCFKEEYQRAKKLAHLKSCDALKIVETRLDFIEMKGFIQLFSNPKVPATQKEAVKVAQNISDFKISDKIKDSLKLWDFLIHEGNVLSGSELRDIETNVQFQFILLTDVEIGSVEWLALNFNYFAEYNSNLDAFLAQKLQAQLQGIDSAIIARIKNLPLLKRCSEIDVYYT